MSKQPSPSLRFNGFSGAWEEKYLNEIGDFFAGGDIKKEKLKPFGSYPVLANALTNNSIVGFYDDYEFESPAITITGRGDVGVAKARKENFSAVVRLLVLKNKPNYDVDFLEQVINKIDFHIESTGVPQLTVPQCKSYSIYSPDFPEQTQIGHFFCHLDQLIDENRAILEKSRQLKKAMLAKMFPAHGEKMPKIRFKGFEGKWKREPLKDVVNVFDNLRIPVSESERISGNTPYFGANGIQDYVDGFTHDGEFVLIAEDGANDLQNYPVQYFNGKGWVNNHAHVLQGKADVLNNLFLFSRFQSMDISRFLVGGGRAKLNGSVMLEIEIEFPIDKQEQTQIGNFFRQLDETIAFQAAELEKLSQLKKGLLAMMLV